MKAEEEKTHRQIININKSEIKPFFGLTVVMGSNYLAKNNVLPVVLVHNTFVNRRPILKTCWHSPHLYLP